MSIYMHITLIWQDSASSHPRPLCVSLLVPCVCEWVWDCGYCRDAGTAGRVEPLGVGAVGQAGKGGRATGMHIVVASSA